MATRLRVGSSIFLIALLAPQFSAAYEHPLSSHSIWEAYFLGCRSDDGLARFLAPYVKRLPLPKSGAHVAAVEIRTPYEQVVLRRLQRSVDYSPQQAEQDYRAQPDVVVVRVRINLTPTYPGYLGDTSQGRPSVQLRSVDFWRDFSIRLVQTKAVTPKKIAGTPLYSPRSGLTGAEVDAAEVISAPARIEVLTPDGHSVDAEFDLEKLR